MTGGGAGGSSPSQKSVRVVVAPDKFKGSLTAGEVAAALAQGLRDGRPGVAAVELPVADGGDGTVAAALAAGFHPVTARVEGPTGVVVDTVYAAWGPRAVVELAATCGLGRLPDGRLEPLRSSTYGLGQVIAHAAASGATEIVVGLGGSASTDGGAAMVQALGARLLDERGSEVPRGGAALTQARTLDLSGVRARLAGVRVLVASDVDNPLLGPRGAAAVFGPQKGAGPHEVATLEAGLTAWADVVTRTTGRDDTARPGAGAAGGTGYAALALLDATIEPGIELVLGLLDFDTAVRGADLVVTGEGSLDEQSLAGKAPVGVAAAAARAGVPTVAVAGRNLLSRERLLEAGIAAVYPLSDLEPVPARSIAHAAVLLRAVGHRIAQDRLP